MSRQNYTFTSESVSEGHPDKLCDRISDAILDNVIKKDKKARVACETFATTNLVVVGGEIGMKDEKKLRGYMPGGHRIEAIVRDCVREIGYEQDGFNWKTLRVLNLLHRQSEDIAQGVTGEGGRDKGAGDQGIMFGYAVNETDELMPAPILYSHRIMQRLNREWQEQLKKARESDEVPQLGPDAKCQLSIRYEEGKPVGVSSIVLSTQHLDENLNSFDVRKLVEPLVHEALPDGWLSDETVWHVNPTGKFVIGGPDGDAGLTGRKIIVDTYGGAAPHGGGAFSGKDPSKVDRSAAYAARYLAKNVVAAELASRCTLQLSYAIGVAEPLSIYVDTHGTGKVADSVIESAIESAVKCHMDGLTPQGIRDHLELDNPIYKCTSAYGHFGREPDSMVEGSFSWERTNLIESLKNAV